MAATIAQDLFHPYNNNNTIISKGWPNLCDKIKENTKRIDDLVKMLDDGVYIIQNGCITTLQPKPFGQDTLLWKNGEVLDVERSERIRIKS